MPAYCLGKKPQKVDQRTLQFGKYLKPKLKIYLPPTLLWGQKLASWPMMANDRIGDCVIAAAGHMVEEWTKEASGVPSLIPDNQIIKAYSDMSGYDPVSGANDNGVVMLDFLNYWRKTGVGGHLIDYYTQLKLLSAFQLKESIYLFGNAFVGLNLPLSAKDQIDAGLPWHVLPTGIAGKGAPGSWGGHSIPLIGWDATGLFGVSWAMIVHLTWNFWYAYGAEAYAVLTREWIAASGLSPDNFDYPTLRTDVANIAA